LLPSAPDRGTFKRMDRKSRRIAGWKGRLLLVLAFVAAVGPAWASTYLCPMARAEAPSIHSSCCAHKEAGTGTFTVALRDACHCPIPAWQASAAVQEKSIPVPVVACGVPEAGNVPSPVAVSTPNSMRPVAVVPTGPPLWVRHQSILC